MTFRYKTALLSLTSLALVYGWYFAHVLAIGSQGPSDGNIGTLIETVVVLCIVQVAGVIVVTLTGERRARTDERERRFNLTATCVGYYALIVGIFGLLPLLAASRSFETLANSLLLVVVVAECARQGVFLLQHHRAA